MNIRYIKLINYFSYLLIWIVVFIWLSIIYFWFKPKVCFDEVCFNVQVAKSTSDLSKWLMEIDYLESTKWMLFVFPDLDYHSFWMYNTYIPLDIIWISEDYRVVDVVKSVKPCFEISECEIYNPNHMSKYVLEINWWLFDYYNLEIWDFVNIKY